MARKSPARKANGQFKKGGRSSSSSRRRSTTKRRAATRRRNPPRRKDIAARVMSAAGDALALTGGQAVTRIAPRLLGLPQAGPVGLAISTAAAVVVGLGAEQFMGKDLARIVTAGAASVPLQQAIMTYVAPHVPLVGAAITPTLGAYPGRRRLPAGGRRGLSAYPRRAIAAPASGNGFNYAFAG